MDPNIEWPLVSNVIRGHSTHNTFGMVRTYENGTPKPHQGWDFQAQVGTAAYAISDGKIAWLKDQGDYGLQLCMGFKFQGKTLYAFYAHLKLIYVTKDQIVEANDLVAACGKSGNASNLPAAEDHLHFEIRTKEHPGFGLHDRLSPVKVFGHCPLYAPVAG